MWWRGLGADAAAPAAAAVAQPLHEMAARVDGLEARMETMERKLSLQMAAILAAVQPKDSAEARGSNGATNGAAPGEVPRVNNAV